MMAEPDIARFLTNSLSNPSARSRSIRTTTKMSGLEPANHGPATACRSATEFINPPMEAKPGITLVWKDRSGLLESQLLPEKATLFSRPCQARSGAIHQIAVFIKRATAVKSGNKFLRERSEEHTSELQSRVDLVCRLLLEKK